MGIVDYTGYFHDGGIDSIKHENNTVELDIESFEILSEWGITEFSLTEDKRIKGKLILFDVKKILFMDEPSSDINRTGVGEILDLIIEGNRLELLTNWYTFDKGPQHVFEYLSFEFSTLRWVDESQGSSF